ncbi:hypothetical protein [Oryzobacter telluris]|uniref:hypothetical protein n=1 Tax=Oryzobacter telluris TaxID=3149179 RepID=UPI00370D7DC7
MTKGERSILHDTDLTVVHLVSASYGTGPVEQFADAYRRHDPGCPHRLLVLLSGIRADRAPQHLVALQGIEYDAMEVPRSTIDLQSYRVAAAEVQTRRLCFLNSHSAPVSDGWLRRLDEAWRAPGVGLVGATGSWESMGNARPWRRWPEFPNAHLRTNAFLIERDLMTSLWWPTVTSKHRAWELESGRRSLTRQVQSRDLGVFVVGREGVFAPEQWAVSHTFRSGGQSNLLVADNRTRQWAEADSRTREHLSTLAWGSGGDSL